MDERITRDDLLKVGGLATLGGAAALAAPGSARASEIPPPPASGYTQVYIQSYVRGDGLPNLLVQGSAFSVPVLHSGTATPGDLLADPTTGVPGMGFDVEFEAVVVGKHEPRNSSFCFLTFTQGALNGWPPMQGGGQDAVRLWGTATEAVDPANLGAPVKLHAISGLPVVPGHNICRVKFDFAGFVFLGVGLALINT